jgi:TatD DNase family protein
VIIDSHVNLHGEQFTDDLDEVLERASQADVSGMITICDRLENWSAVRAIAHKQESIWCSVGVHPHYAKDYTDLTAAKLISLAKDEPKVVGIGECGLDLYYAHSPLEAQLPVLRAHIEAARWLDLPIILHTRDADDLMADLLEEEYSKAPFAILLHCYTSGAQLAQRALELGAYFSMSGIMTFKAADDVRAVAQTLPLDRVIVETDCPYLAPIPHRGRRNEPAYVRDVLAYWGDFRGISFEEAASITTENFFRLFPRARVQA